MMLSDNEDDDYSELITAHNRKHKKAGGFQSLGLDQPIFHGIERKGFKQPTPIQRKAIPLILAGKDVVAMARTGSGKTAAFLIPMFQKLKTRVSTGGARALLIAPTRELVLQTFKMLKELSRFCGLRAVVLVGGESIEDQFAAIHANPDIILATPGRLLHLVVEMNLKLSSIKYVVFDEADRLLEFGFDEQLREVMKRLSGDRQTLLFSATLPKMLVQFARAGLTDPTLVRLDLDNKLSELLETSFLSCRFEDKLPTLFFLLRTVIPSNEQAIIFCASKHHVEFLAEVLLAASFPCSRLYSSMDSDARIEAMQKFSSKNVRFLVVTDLAARGVDIPLLDNAINFHFPAKPKLFVHRVGRVARAGRRGKSYSIVSSDELPYLLDLFLFLGRSVVFSGDPSATRNDCIGLVDQEDIDTEESTLRTIEDNSYELKLLRRSMENGFKKYAKSRPLASKESAKRAKEVQKTQMQKLAVHPWLKDLVSHDDTGDDEPGAKKSKHGENVTSRTSDLLHGLRNWKPSVTVFELNRTSRKHPSCAMMKAKRKAHERYVKRPVDMDNESNIKQVEIGASKLEIVGASENDIAETFSEVLVSQPSTSIPRTKRKQQKKVDTTHFVPYQPADFHVEHGLGIDRKSNSFEKDAAAVVLDFTADDDQTMSKQKGNKKIWDRTRKKFVAQNDGNDPRKRKVRTESGVLIPATYKTKLYEEWLKKQKMDTTTISENGDSSNSKRFESYLIRKRGQGQKRNYYAEAQKAKESRPVGKRELKSKEQVLKARKKREKVQSFQKTQQLKKKKSKRGKGKRID